MSKQKTSLLDKTRNLSLRADERGLSTVEYVILLVLIAVIAFAGWQILGKEVKRGVGKANTEMKKL